MLSPLPRGGLVMAVGTHKLGSGTPSSYATPSNARGVAVAVGIPGPHLNKTTLSGEQYPQNDF